MFAWIVDNVKLVGSCATGVTAICGGYIYMEGPIPATKGYVIAQTEALKYGVIERGLEINDIKRQLLRKEKFDRSIELERTQEPNVKRLIQERLDSVNDDLDRVDKAREDLRKEKAAR